ncbi:hypothetical protein L484_026512 [Morus notabilis]|uniref:WIT1/2 N-terminal helical bundle domain-containing protein n=1 Tax=Morus notabilis TaxID=981085 RepID=W9QZ23_9ROSA|nr:hypothetical protein L484_026512 [Morus notabilis]
MEDPITDIDIEGPDPDKKDIDEVKDKETLELESCMEVLTKLDLDLAYSSEKLVNLHGLSMHLSAQENELEARAMGNNYTSTEFVEKTLVFDLLSGVLESEVRELDSFMVSLQAEIVDAHQKISSCRHLTEPYTMMEEKLHDSEESLKQTQHRISEVKIQSTKLQRTVLAFAHDNWKGNIDESMSNTNGQSNLQIAGQRHILKMLEKSLARELDLEKKLAESRRSEEELRVKLHYTEQVAFHMEETAQVVWGRFLEADNSSVVLKGISHELLGRLQLVQFNLNGTVQRESELKSKYQDCLQELEEKNAVLEKLKSSTAENSAYEAELSALREKVQVLEEKLKESELKLKNANVINHSSQIKLREMENIVESLKESIDVADTRAESAELKVAELNGTNVELTEELNFLKGSVTNTEKKVGVLEKQLREAEIQLQHAKASSEASQEQQNMLYSAIWDMETLIEDLKSKVTKAENKTETSEEHCIILSETNEELTKEISTLRDRIEYLEASLVQAKNAKFESANEINVRTKFMMDMVLQLATERERIQNQLNVLTKENKTFADNFGYTVKNVYNEEEDDHDDKELSSFKTNLSNSSCAKSSLEAVNDSIGKSLEAEEEESLCEDGESDAVSVDDSDGTVSKLQDSRAASARCLNFKYFLVAIFVSLVSVSAMYLINHKPFLFH